MRDPLHLSITVDSSWMTPDEMIELIGFQPVRSTAKGSPVSLRKPDGPKRDKSSLRYEAAMETDWDINALAEELRPLMVRLAALKGQFDLARIWLMAHGRPMGAWMTLLPEYMRLIADADLPFELDMYCGDECCQEDESD